MIEDLEDHNSRLKQENDELHHDLDEAQKELVEYRQRKLCEQTGFKEVNEREVLKLPKFENDPGPRRSSCIWGLAAKA